MHRLRLLRRRALAFVACILAVGLAHAAPVRTDHVNAELVADRAALVPGTTTTLALRLDIDRGWHTYWRNPGESGLPTTLAWKLPAGYQAGDIEWPAPKALPAGPLVNYGYEGVVLHLVPLRVPADAAVGQNVTLAARADWLVCRETCVPEGADLTLVLPVAGDAVPSKWHDAIAATQAALPKPLPGSWKTSAVAKGSRIALTLTPPANAADPGRLQFFADDERRIEASAPQTREAANGQYVLDLPVSHELKGGFASLRGVLRGATGFATDNGVVAAAAIDVPIAGTPIAGPKPVIDASAVTASAASLPTGAANIAAWPVAVALAFALVGGVLLNLMPCVFPILSLKALGLASSDGDRGALRQEGVAFAAGVVVAFAALGLVLLALRAGGAELGWGFQLQSPAVVTALAILFFVIAQNLSGVFEFGAFVPSGVASFAHANRHVNAFASGLLAVAVASPCTAPFMGAALGYALTAPVVVTLGVFLALGVGMALPYGLLAWFPQWRRMLPRPGPWLVRLKQVLAFPLYATVAWLAWVLAAQVGIDAVLRLGLVLVLVALALFAWRAWRSAGSAAWTGAVAAAVVGAAIVVWPLFVGGGTQEVPRTASGDGWQTFSPAGVAQLTAEGRPVFVDFTAAWCITCQVNERFVLNDARVRDAFAQNGVALVRADWTRRDPAITQALAELGRSGVPVYVLYRPGRAPLVLPEVLERRVVIDALAS
jgi:thiol:disulfide interchange protein DsbD